MALTLQERVNLCKGLVMADLATTPVTNIEKIDAQLKKIAGEILSGTLSRVEIPNVATYNPSDAQLREWCNRVLDNSEMAQRMAPLIISANIWDTDGANISDAAVRVTCLNCVSVHAAKI